MTPLASTVYIRRLKLDFTKSTLHFSAGNYPFNFRYQAQTAI
jgi:hypothetical protein